MILKRYERERPDVLDLARQWLRPEGKRFAVIEGNEDCNRACTYCAVPFHYNKETELTVGQTNATVDWLYQQGYRVLSYLGGEPFAPFRTKEGISFSDHTLNVVSHAKEKGMLVNVTSNGDYIKPSVIQSLRDVGLDSLTLSLHTYTKQGLHHLLEVAMESAEHTILPTIQTVMTSDTAEFLPSIAAESARHGALYSIGIVQTQGDGFSAQQDESVIPSQYTQEEIFGALIPLKRYGFVRNNMQYLTKSPSYYPNTWVCDASRDSFIKIGAGGKVNVCSRVETGIRVEDITTLDDPVWREKKQIGVSRCEGCLFHCYYESENIDILGDIPMIAVGLAIKSGRHTLVKQWGKRAVSNAINKHPDIDWSMFQE